MSIYLFHTVTHPFSILLQVHPLSYTALMALALGHTFREGYSVLGNYLWLKNVVAPLADKAWKAMHTHDNPRCHQKMNSMAQHFATTYIPQPHCFMNDFTAPLVQTEAGRRRFGHKSFPHRHVTVQRSISVRNRIMDNLYTPSCFQNFKILLCSISPFWNVFITYTTDLTRQSKIIKNIAYRLKTHFLQLLKT